MEDRYLTIARAARHEIKVKGSRFIGETAPVTDAAEARLQWEEVRKREHAATHHCYAYRVGVHRGISFRYSDDGEPSGSAGKPIFDVLCGRELTDTLIVVTRYFGGTKLGTGGLARAYGTAAREVVEKAGIKENHLTEEWTVRVPLPLYDRVDRLLRTACADVEKAEFAENVLLSVKVRISLADRLERELVQLTSDRVTIERGRHE